MRKTLHFTLNNSLMNEKETAASSKFTTDETLHGKLQFSHNVGDSKFLSFCIIKMNINWYFLTYFIQYFWPNDFCNFAIASAQEAVKKNKTKIKALCAEGYQPLPWKIFLAFPHRVTPLENETFWPVSGIQNFQNSISPLTIGRGGAHCARV